MDMQPVLLWAREDVLFIINGLQKCDIYYVYQMKIDT